MVRAGLNVLQLLGSKVFDKNYFLSECFITECHHVWKLTNFIEDMVILVLIAQKLWIFTNLV